MWLTWQAAAVIAALLGALGLLLRGRDRHDVIVIGAVARESALVLGLYATWQWVRELAITHATGAISHATWIWHAERVLPFPSELTLQRAFLPHPMLIEACNEYYAVMHVPALVVFLVWLFARHRERYAGVRTTLALATSGCLLLQLIPVAPPRMLPALGFVDTGLRYGQSVYGPLGSGIAAQLSAMPSVHVAWAVLVGLAVVQVSPSRWRWVVLAHPVATVLVVTATANHWWLDGLVAVAVLLLAGRIQAAGRAALARHAHAPMDKRSETTVTVGTARVAAGRARLGRSAVPEPSFQARERSVV